MKLSLLTFLVFSFFFLLEHPALADCPPLSELSVDPDFQGRDPQYLIIHKKFNSTKYYAPLIPTSFSTSKFWDLFNRKRTKLSKPFRHFFYARVVEPYWKPEKVLTIEERPAGIYGKNQCVYTVVRKRKILAYAVIREIPKP